LLLIFKMFNGLMNNPVYWPEYGRNVGRNMVPYNLKI
jgi:hypothetical protein